MKAPALFPRCRWGPARLGAIFFSPLTASLRFRPGRNGSSTALFLPAACAERHVALLSCGQACSCCATTLADERV